MPQQAMPQNHEKVVMRAIRDGCGEGIMIAAAEDHNVVALCADLTESDRLLEFKAAYPDRFVEIGVAEQNLVGVAAGMAHAGKVPFAASFAVFSPGRSWDQIRVSCCYSGANVKLYGGHAGITVGQDGATHQALEDIAITRVLPRMTVIVPADAIEMRKATIAAAKMRGPVYLRGGREKFPQVTAEDSPFVIGKANELLKGKDVTIIACGIMVREAVLAAQELKAKGVSAGVLNLHTIKPIDENAVIGAAATGGIVTAEEHQVAGGMGSAVCEVLATRYPVPVEMVGIKDTFGESGTAAELMDKYGLRASAIVEAVQRVLERKKKVKGALRVTAGQLKKLGNAKKRRKT
jgi:transketolase